MVRPISVLTRRAMLVLQHAVAVCRRENTVGDAVVETWVPLCQMVHRDNVISCKVSTEAHVVVGNLVFVTSRVGLWRSGELSGFGVHKSRTIS